MLGGKTMKSNDILLFPFVEKKLAFIILKSEQSSRTVQMEDLKKGSSYSQTAHCQCQFMSIKFNGIPDIPVPSQTAI
jgi:hypothetical protein